MTTSQSRTSAKIWNSISVDVEDWFHIMEVAAAPEKAEWDRQPGRVVPNTHKLLELFAARRVSATFFFLGWVAERHPDLVEAVAARGHEVASHGYSHDLVHQLSRAEFEMDLRRSVDILAGVTGTRPAGYRAPGFSITRESLWAFDIIASAGFAYDSSVFPTGRLHGGWRQGGQRPHRLLTAGGKSLDEFPITTANVLGQRLAFSGGGYLRFCPLPMLMRWTHALNRQGIPVIVYVHPREVDPSHPRIHMPLGRRFRSYVGLSSTVRKLGALLDAFPFTTVRNALGEYAAGNVVETVHLGAR